MNLKIDGYFKSRYDKKVIGHNRAFVSFSLSCSKIRISIGGNMKK